MSDTYPSRTSVVLGCNAVRWSDIMALTGLSSIAEIDIGLRTQIGGLAKLHANEEYAKRLNSLFASHSIVPPDEGQFSDLLHDLVMQSFLDLGHQWIWVGDEFGTERQLHWIEDLKNNDLNITTGHCNVFTSDKSLLWTTHWDSHFSFLCGNSKDLVRIVQSAHLEGFFCESNTERAIRPLRKIPSALGRLLPPNRSCKVMPLAKLKWLNPSPSHHPHVHLGLWGYFSYVNFGVFKSQSKLNNDHYPTFSTR